MRSPRWTQISPGACRPRLSAEDAPRGGWPGRGRRRADPVVAVWSREPSARACAVAPARPRPAKQLLSGCAPGAWIRLGSVMCPPTSSLPMPRWKPSRRCSPVIPTVSWPSAALVRTRSPATALTCWPCSMSSDTRFRRIRCRCPRPRGTSPWRHERRMLLVWLPGGTTDRRCG